METQQLLSLKGETGRAEGHASRGRWCPSGPKGYEIKTHLVRVVTLSEGEDPVNLASHTSTGKKQKIVQKLK